MATSEAPVPVILPHKQITANEFNIIYIDLETTSLRMDAGITQIAAVFNNESFNQYVLPECEVSKQSSEVTGLTVKMGNLCLHGEQVDSIPIKPALKKFITWLGNIGSCVLVAHNARFDASRIMNHVHLCNLTKEFLKIVLGFSDTLPMFRELYPDLKEYSQQSLVMQLLEKEYDAHNASDDAEMLRDLVHFSHASYENLLAHGFSSTWMSQALPLVRSFDKVVEDNIIYMAYAEKLGYSGLHIDQLRQEYQSGRFRSVKASVNGVVSDAVVRRLCKYFSKN